jgi:putative acetyltransferase
MSTDSRAAIPLASIAVRVEQPQDEGAIAALLVAAFGQPGEARLVQRLRDSTDYLPGLALVAEGDRQILGHILFSRAQLSDRAVPVRVLAPLAVQPAHQGNGIGSLLVQRGLAAVAAQGPALVTVLGAPDYYRRFGFRPAASWGIEHPFAVPAEVFMAQLVGAAGPEVLGPLSGRLSYAAAFDPMITESIYDDAHGI